MGRYVLKGKPEVEVTLRRSSRARRLSLRVSRLDGRVTLTMPMRAAERDAHAFIEDRAEWLRQHVSDIGGEIPVQIGGTIPYQGQDLPIIAQTGRKTQLIDNTLYVPQDPEKTGVRVRAFLKVEARNHLAAASDRYAAQLGRSYGKITLRDTRSRWGSCTSAGDLMYSWRLIMAPPEVLNYVAAHEVAHLVEMNHSADFWAIVADLFPDHRRCRDWLNSSGNDLHRIRFGD